MTDDLATIHAKMIQFEAATGRRSEVLYLGESVANRVTGVFGVSASDAQRWTLFGVPVLRVLRAPEHVGVA